MACRLTPPGCARRKLALRLAILGTRGIPYPMRRQTEQSQCHRPPGIVSIVWVVVECLLDEVDRIRVTLR